ncbi:DUF4845 domain-containing protein [Diaphorobacter aerolatus]|uniref:DUF4845 domain-containing protein n=1 Tax=Diaphorobacter aerolatus TaxID=1288495 RepID=A0A7H0GI67_9BURK|nr:DUF4845 domain-containing protein [Diaphorobacter aerolatus]QNP47983.1 DUF4845 domain-containing protein [Diaphorobacter aerolatus]
MALHRNSTLRSRQRGLSFVSLVFILVIAVAIGYVATKSFPLLMEWQAVHKAVKKAAAEGSNVPAVRAAFDRAATIDDIRSISGKDLEVTKENDNVVVFYEYSSEIPLYGPAYLLYRFKGSSK